MAFQRERAEAFAVALTAAWDDQRAHELLWEAAARGAGLHGRDVRVAREGNLAFLIAATWIVEMGGEGWTVRAWQDEADPLWESARELGALDEPWDEDDDEEED